MVSSHMNEVLEFVWSDVGRYCGQINCYGVPVPNKKAEGVCNNFQNEGYSLLGRDGVLNGN